jgi:hypothetical protein
MESGYRRKKNEFFASSLERSGLLVYFSRSISGPRTDKEIKFLLETDYDRCYMTGAHGSHYIFEMRQIGKRVSQEGERVSCLFT